MTDLGDHDLLPDSEVRFVEEGDLWVAHHDLSGVVSQGRTRGEAHEMITEAVLLYRGEIGEPIETWEDEKELLEELDLTDEEIAELKKSRDDDPQELPEFLQ